MPAAEILARLDWVRPVAAAMRAVNLPEAVVQKSMTALLAILDEHLDGPQARDRAPPRRRHSSPPMLRARAGHDRHTSKKKQEKNPP